jgi:hypothetical protein
MNEWMNEWFTPKRDWGDISSSSFLKLLESLGCLQLCHSWDSSFDSYSCS